MHEYWLQFFTAALSANGDAADAEVAADDACHIYDRRVSDARRASADTNARLARDKSFDSLVLDALPSFAPGVTKEHVRKTVKSDYDAVTASLARLRIEEQIIEQGNGGGPLTYYRKAVLDQEDIDQASPEAPNQWVVVWPGKNGQANRIAERTGEFSCWAGNGNVSRRFTQDAAETEAAARRARSPRPDLSKIAAVRLSDAPPRPVSAFGGA